MSRKECHQPGWRASRLSRIRPSRSGPGDTVELEQDADVAWLGTAAARLDAEDRGGGPFELACGLFAGEPGGLAAAQEFEGQAAGSEGRVLLGAAVPGHACTTPLALI